MKQEMNEKEINKMYRETKAYRFKGPNRTKKKARRARQKVKRE